MTRSLLSRRNRQLPTRLAVMRTLLFFLSWVVIENIPEGWPAAGDLQDREPGLVHRDA